MKKNLLKKFVTSHFEKTKLCTFFCKRFNFCVYLNVENGGGFALDFIEPNQTTRNSLSGYVKKLMDGEN